MKERLVVMLKDYIKIILDLIKSKNIKLFEEFLKSINYDSTYINGKIKGTPILILATMENNIKVVQLLLEHGAEVDAVDLNTGYTAFMEAMKRGYYHIADLFLHYGADINFISSIDGKSAIAMALEENSESKIKFLISNNARIDSLKMMHNIVNAKKDNIYFFSVDRQKKNLKRSSVSETNKINESSHNIITNINVDFVEEHKKILKAKVRKVLVEYKLYNNKERLVYNSLTIKNFTSYMTDEDKKNILLSFIVNGDLYLLKKFIVNFEDIRKFIIRDTVIPVLPVVLDKIDVVKLFFEHNLYFQDESKIGFNIIELSCSKYMRELFNNYIEKRKLSSNQNIGKVNFVE